MKVVRETCIAGRVIDVTIKASSGNHARRSEKKKVTSEAVQKVNDRYAQKRLERIINANFSEKDFHDTLTYEGEAPDPEEAQKNLRRFLERVKYAMKKKGQEFKWVIVTEWKNKRIHHHMVTNAPEELIRKQWKSGHIFTSRLYESEDYSQLAAYLIKETEKTFRDGDSAVKERYSRSRNLTVPEVRVEEVDARQLFEDPKPWKGYQIIEESVRRYEHPVTGLEYLEYKMISVTDKPRLKRRYKGKIKKREENYWNYINYIEEQMSLL